MMPGYVQNLTNKIVNSDPVNARSGIGNLYAGSSDTQMERLIGKCFLGNDQPTTPYSYQYAQGSLFQNGISYTDVGYDAATQRFTLFNPWGTGGGYEGSTYKPGYLYLTWDQLTASFNSWDYAAVS